MSKTVWAAIAVLVMAIGLGAYWLGTDRPTEVALSPNPQMSPTRPEPRLPGRLYLSQAQLEQAYSAGDLDRPIKSLIAVDKKLEHGEYRWNDEGVPAGRTWIRVDLNAQILSVFRAGHEIGTAVILYGAQSKQTPAGIYPIKAKARDHRSSIYDAEMPFTLRLTDDGISIHASNVRWGAATHGCIGIPNLFAEKLFDSVSVRDDVVVIDKRDARRVATAKS